MERHGLRGAWCVGERRGALLASLDAYKFERTKAAAGEFARLLDATTPIIESECVVTSIPTAPSHIRVRGYDHAALIAQEFARLRGLPFLQMLDRESSGTQHFSTRRERFIDAKQAFTLRQSRPAVFLIDDIVTTGATLEAATELLLEGGATRVYVGVIARQPLDDSAHL
jgi:ComF family protein